MESSSTSALDTQVRRRWTAPVNPTRLESDTLPPQAIQDGSDNQDQSYDETLTQFITASEGPSACLENTHQTSSSDDAPQGGTAISLAPGPTRSPKVSNVVESPPLLPSVSNINVHDRTCGLCKFQALMQWTGLDKVTEPGVCQAYPCRIRLFDVHQAIHLSIFDPPS
jgi:hypothetical protein